MSQRKVLSEKEFLDKCIFHLLDKGMFATDESDNITFEIDNFLTEFHKNYYEVEFIPCRSKTEIFANEISDISLVLDKSLPDDTLVIKQDDIVVHTIKLGTVG